MNKPQRDTKSSDELSFDLEETFGQDTNKTPNETRGQQLSLSQLAMRQRAKAVDHQMDYLAGLNKEQKEAVITLDGPLLVLAGAGTGKTRVLTTRIAHLLASKKAWPSQILAVTFTNKAAKEMKQRIESMIGGAVEGMPWLGTFHSIGVKILRRHAEAVGLKSSFTILDTDDTLRLLKQLIKAEGLDEKRWPARQLAHLIDSWKNRALTPEKVPNGEGFSFANGKGGKLYKAYQTRLKELNAVDFGDLLLEMIRLFETHEDLRADYARKFAYILVDEYQDTNQAQYKWLKLLAKGSDDPNICCVGDDDQSIYGWRGAEVDNILKFEKDFPSSRIIRLEENYRSTGHILASADAVISNNENRLGKVLKPQTGDGEKVHLTGYWDDAEEARSIGERIESLQIKGHALNEIAILVRASFQMRAFEDRFVTMGLPYRVIGGPRFYERMEIKDACAYFDVVLNPDNDLKFERIFNTPKRGLGDKALQKLRDQARKDQSSLYKAAIEMLELGLITGRQGTSLNQLISNFERWRADIKTMSHTELAGVILDESGYTQMWQKDKSPNAPARLDNLKELLRYMEEFENLAGFMEHVSLVMDAEANSDGDRVNLMTLHAAKGLEFETVFLPGWEEGLFPHQRNLDETGLKGLEEERRLAYVGLTRPKENCFISFTQNRRIHGQYTSAIPSRFVDELNPAHVQLDEGGMPGNFQTVSSSRFDEMSLDQGQSSPMANRYRSGAGDNRSSGGRNQGRTPPTLDLKAVRKKQAAASDHDFALGERVFHQKFGYGLIADIEGDKLTIDFEKASRKKVVASYVERH